MTATARGAGAGAAHRQHAAHGAAHPRAFRRGPAAAVAADRAGHRSGRKLEPADIPTPSRRCGGGWSWCNSSRRCSTGTRPRAARSALRSGRQPRRADGRDAGRGRVPRRDRRAGREPTSPATGTGSAAFLGSSGTISTPTRPCPTSRNAPAHGDRAAGRTLADRPARASGDRRRLHRLARGDAAADAAVARLPQGRGGCPASTPTCPAMSGPGSTTDDAARITRNTASPR